MIVRLCEYHTVRGVSKFDPDPCAEISPDPRLPAKPPRKLRRTKSHALEFDLGLAPVRKPRTAKARGAPVSPSAPNDSVSSGEPPSFRSGPRSQPTPDRSEPVATASVTPQSESESPATESVVALNPLSPEPERKEPRMNPTQPEPLNVKKTIERQSREQQAMSHLLNGVAIAFVCGLLLVASLAGLGGYVLYKQLMNQSASLALLETNTLERFAELESRMAARNRELAQLQQEANLRLTNLQGQFEQYRSQTTQSISLLTSANARLERRLAEYRQELLRQEQLLSLNETSPIRRVR